MREFLFASHASLQSFVCVENGAVVGWTALTPFRVKEDAKHTAEMSLYVQESCRCRGIGSALAHALLKQATILDLHCIFVMVFKDMPAGISFAERNCGFSITGCLPELFADGGKFYDILVLERLVQ